MKQIIDDLREIVAEPDVYEHNYPSIIRRIADRLEAAAATALVPVPVEPMMLGAMGHPIRFFKHPYDGRICERLHPCPTQLDYLVCIFGEKQHEWWPRNRRVTPVRLVPALEALEGRDDG